MKMSLDRDELHRQLEDNDLVTILDTLRGESVGDFEGGVREIGEEVRTATNAELIDDLGTPLDASDRVIGYFALLYEAENDEPIEIELDNRVTTTRR